MEGLLIFIDSGTYSTWHSTCPVSTLGFALSHSSLDSVCHFVSSRRDRNSSLVYSGAWKISATFITSQRLLVHIGSLRCDSGANPVSPSRTPRYSGPLHDRHCRQGHSILSWEPQQAILPETPLQDLITQGHERHHQPNFLLVVKPLVSLWTSKELIVIWALLPGSGAFIWASRKADGSCMGKMCVISKQL